VNTYIVEIHAPPILDQVGKMRAAREERSDESFADKFDY